MKNATGQITILLIEDDDLSRELLALQMTASGYLITAVESGDAALTYLDQRGQQGLQQVPDVILTDLQMPGLSGLELAGRLRTATAAGEPPILLAMSASRPELTPGEAFDGFLLKPFTMEQLMMEQLMAQVAAGWNAPSTPDTPAPGQTSNLCLDEDVFQQLARSMPATQLQQLYEMCLNDAEARIGHMGLAASTSDLDLYQREAHAIKGSAGMVGALELQNLASAAEMQEFAVANHRATLNELLMACGRLRRILVGHENWAN